MNKVFKEIDESPRHEQIIYYKEPLQRVQDYTKNISQGIFSPGYVEDKVHRKLDRGFGKSLGVRRSLEVRASKS